MSNDVKLDPSVYLKEAPAAHRIQRDGDRDLSFQGWSIGKSCVQSLTAPPSELPADVAARMTNARQVADAFRQLAAERIAKRETCAEIFVTIGGTYVAQVYRAKHYGDGRREVNAEVEVTQSPHTILAFLRASNRGSLGQASHDAWSRACGRFAPLAAHLTEHIE
jgi:hypothetical protein